MRVRVYRVAPGLREELVSEGDALDPAHPQEFLDYIRAVQAYHGEGWAEYLRAKGAPLALLHRGYSFEEVEV